MAEVEPRSRRGWVWPLLVAVVTGCYAAIPLLLRPGFYLRGDSAAQFAPTWFHLGTLVSAGQWPPAMDPDAFAGGNYAAEALYGVYSPVAAGIWLLVSHMDSLLLSVWLVKTACLVVLALGTYLLCREYDAAPWAAAAVATAVPFSGFTLFWDAGSWAAGLLAFAHIPWVWWALRRMRRGLLNPIWAFAIGVLGVLQGNPYGTLGVVAVGVAVVIEGLLVGERAGALRTVLVGLCVAAVLPLVYLPLLQSVGLAYRADLPTFYNNGKLRIGLGDLLAFGSPTYVPEVKAVVGDLRVPAAYFAWFALALLPWLRFGVLRAWRPRAAALIVGAGYFMLALGPSQLWLFRWPLRFMEYGWLGVAVLLAVVLSAGLATDRWRARSLGSGVLLAVTAWLTWAQAPSHTAQAFLGPVVLVAGSAVLLGWHRLRPQGHRILALIAIGGTGVVLLTQIVVFGENQSSRVWHIPTSVSQVRQDTADLQGHRVLQIADLKKIQAQTPAKLPALWHDFLPGSMYAVAGVQAVNSYSGMGYEKFTKWFCMDYDGLAKRCGLAHAFQPVVPGHPLSVELLKVDTVVTQPTLSASVTPPAGWTLSDSGNSVVMRRTAPYPYPGSRLSWAQPGVTVTGARSEGTGEVATVTAPTGGDLVFAMLAWPGMSATLDGRSLPVDSNRIGLVTLHLRQGASGTLRLEYAPPGQRPALALAGLGLLAAAALGLWSRRRGAAWRDG